MKTYHATVLIPEDQLPALIVVLLGAGCMLAIEGHQTTKAKPTTDMPVKVKADDSRATWTDERRARHAKAIRKGKRKAAAARKAKRETKGKA